MIFNTAEEISAKTGNYYRNGNFDKLLPFLNAAWTRLAKLVGDGVMELAQQTYDAPYSATDTNKTLLELVQYPIAARACMELYRHNDISHEDNGRKVKIDAEHEKIPWEWQLSRDDEIQLDDYYSGVDNLLRFLEENKVEAWLTMRVRLGLKNLLLPDSDTFSLYWKIDSPRIFIETVPFIKEAQRRYLIPAMSADRFEEMMTAVQGGETPDGYEEACNALALYTMFIVFSRGLYSMMPQGIVQRNMSTDGMYKGDTISFARLREYTCYLEREARSVLDDMKIILKGGQTFSLLPDNDKNNKYMML